VGGVDYSLSQAVSRRCPEESRIAMFAAGSSGTLTNISGKEPIQAVVFDVKGLFFDFSLKGGKFSKLDPADLSE
jgi:hypothetical protein